ADRNRSHWSTSKTPSYTKSVSWQHHQIAAIGEIKTETETTRFYVDYDDLMLSLLKEAAKKMINTCNEYQKRHGKKTLFEVPEV
ncbi:hemolysin E, partial [Escherichia coli]